MTLYEIDQSIASLIDPETGEILNFDAFEALAMEKDEKIENIALWIKDLNAESKAIMEEIKALSERKRISDNKVESLKQYLLHFTAGEKFKTAKVSISYRHSQVVKTDDDFVEWALNHDADELLRTKPAEPNLPAIKQAIKEGRNIEHATIEENTSITIK